MNGLLPFLDNIGYPGYGHTARYDDTLAHHHSNTSAQRILVHFYVYSVCGCQDYTDKNGKKFSDYISVGSAGGWQKGSWEWRRNSTKVVGWLRS